VAPSVPAQTREQAPPYARHRFSVGEYHRMGQAGILRPDARVELVAGEVVEMAPIGARHAEVVDRLTRACLLGAGAQARVRVQGPVRLNDRTEVQPDVALLRPADYSAAPPGPADVLLLIELADTPLAYDRDVKLPLYAAAGIPEVWLVDLPGGRMTVHRAPEQGAYAQVAPAGPAECAQLLPDLTLTLAEVLPAREAPARAFTPRGFSPDRPPRRGRPAWWCRPGCRVRWRRSCAGCGA
jgi:Uma2 family endonuclease